MGRDGLRSWHMDSRLQGGAFLLERIPRIDLRTHDGHLLTGLRTGPPAPWSTPPRSGMRGVSQHRDGQHEPARLRDVGVEVPGDGADMVLREPGHAHSLSDPLDLARARARVYISAAAAARAWSTRW